MPTRQILIIISARTRQLLNKAAFLIPQKDSLEQEGICKTPIIQWSNYLRGVTGTKINVEKLR
jgi:hypothetical protein